MPHVVVKMLAGRTEQQKLRLAEAVTKAVMDTAAVGEESVSVAVEDVAQSDWAAAVYRPDILGKPDTIYKRPGYTM